MDTILSNITISVNEKLYVKNPETSDLGKKIIENSILLIDEIGFETFTFKKLGERIGSNESSIYRYFESKQKLLLYLCSWYWGWIEYKLVFATNNIDNPLEKLKKAITIVSEKIEDDSATTHINEFILNKIIIAEYIKTLLTKVIDDENEEGFFLTYKRVINRIVAMIQDVNVTYEFPKSLASSIVDGAMHQHFLKNHLKTITDCNDEVSPTHFYINLVINTLR